MTFLRRALIAVVILVSGISSCASGTVAETGNEAAASPDAPPAPTTAPTVEPTSEPVIESAPIPHEPEPRDPEPEVADAMLTQSPCSSWAEDPDETMCFQFVVPEGPDDWNTVDLKVIIQGAAVEDLGNADAAPTLVLGGTSLEWGDERLQATLPAAPIVQMSTREGSVLCPEVAIEPSGAVAACSERLTQMQIDPSRYLPAAIAEDVHRLRLALGVEQWSVIISGEPEISGVGLADALISSQAPSIESISVRPASTRPPRIFDQLRSLDNALTRVVMQCASQPNCPDAYPTLEEDIQFMVSGALFDQPVNVDLITGRYRDEEAALKPHDLTLTLAHNLATPGFAALLPALARETRAGGGELVDALLWWPRDRPLTALADDCHAFGGADQQIVLNLVSSVVVEAIGDGLAELCAGLNWNDAVDSSPLPIEPEKDEDWADEPPVVVHLPAGEPAIPAEQELLDRYPDWTILATSMSASPDCMTQTEASVRSGSKPQPLSPSDPCWSSNEVWIRQELPVDPRSFTYTSDYDGAVVVGVRPDNWLAEAGWSSWRRFDHALDPTEVSIDWLPGYSAEEALDEYRYEWAFDPTATAETLTHQTEGREWTLTQDSASDTQTITVAVAMFDDTPVVVTLTSMTTEADALTADVVFPMLESLDYTPGP